jgi:hypothetical protein
LLDHVKKNFIINEKNIYIPNKFLNYKNFKILQSKKLYNLICIKQTFKLLKIKTTTNKNFKLSQLLANKIIQKTKNLNRSFRFRKFFKKFLFYKGIIYLKLLN